MTITHKGIIMDVHGRMVSKIAQEILNVLVADILSEGSPKAKNTMELSARFLPLESPLSSSWKRPHLLEAGHFATHRPCNKLHNSIFSTSTIKRSLCNTHFTLSILLYPHDCQVMLLSYCSSNSNFAGGNHHSTRWFVGVVEWVTTNAFSILLAK